MGDVELKCTVHFHYSDESVPEAIKELLEKLFMFQREEVIELLNPNYERWNKMFDEAYPGLDGESEEYVKFICEKQREILYPYNKKHSLSPLKMDSSEEEAGDIVGKFRHNGKEVTMYFTIKLLNEEEYMESLKKEE